PRRPRGAAERGAGQGARGGSLRGVHHEHPVHPQLQHVGPPGQRDLPARGGCARHSHGPETTSSWRIGGSTVRSREYTAQTTATIGITMIAPTMPATRVAAVTARAATTGCREIGRA